MAPTRINTALLKWYDQFGRATLPWRKKITPYRVWLSEIMLQQTQVATVIPYFERFIQYFPTLNQLAEADLDKVLHLWAGLGYYSRARNLYKTAQLIKEKFNGKFPDNLPQLLELPGIGRSTAGAILAIAFNKPFGILDGNVKRVLTRLYAISGWPGHSATTNLLWRLSEELVSKYRPADYTQAIMDLGATLCTKKAPQCTICPLSEMCTAYKQQQVADYPAPKPKRNKPIKYSHFIIYINPQDEIFLEQRPQLGIWGGLWSLPEYNAEEIGSLAYFSRSRYGLEIIAKHRDLPSFRHTFSHYHLDIFPTIIKVQPKNTIMESQPIIWYNYKQEIGLPAPIKKLLKQVEDIL